jgi:hypothetical protein
LLIGYIRVSKSDVTQTLEPQRDALLAVGIDPSRIYEDLASGRHDARPGLTACLRRCNRATRSSSGSSTGSAAICATWSRPPRISGRAGSG